MTATAQAIRPYPPVLTTADVARLLKISPAAVRRMNLPALEVSKGKWRYVLSQVLAELERRAEGGRAA